MKAFTAVQALLAIIVVFVTLWHGSDGVTQISSQVRTQRSIYFHNRGKAVVSRHFFYSFHVKPGLVNVKQVGRNLTSLFFLGVAP